MKNVFNKVKKTNIWKSWCLRWAVLSLYRNHLIDLFCKLMRWFLCNGNNGVKKQRALLNIKYFFLDYDANLTTVITWGSNSVIYNPAMLIFLYHTISWEFTSSTIKNFTKFWGPCFKFWLCSCLLSTFSCFFISTILSLSTEISILCSFNFVQHNYVRPSVWNDMISLNIKVPQYFDLAVFNYTFSVVIVPFNLPN